MKKAVILLSVLSLHLVLFAQHRQVKIAGSVGVANVNISVLNTRYGTSSDAGGRYELLLFDRTKPVDLLYTCIGYRDTVVSLTPRMLQHDSVGISFVMRRTDYDLQEVGVSASRDFYRTGTGTSIADIGFLGDRVLVLEQRKGKSELVVVSLEGEREAQCAFDSLYESIHVDCLGDCILVGAQHCCQVYFAGGNSPVPFKTFPTTLFNEKLLNCVADFGGALVFKDQNANISRFFVRKDHNKTQRYFYVKKEDPTHEKRPLLNFIDGEAMSTCQSVLNELIMTYHTKVSESEDEILIGTWNGNVKRLMLEPETFNIASRYLLLESEPLNVETIMVKDRLLFVDFNKKEVVEVGKEFLIESRKVLRVSNDKWFRNHFFVDETTARIYGLFIKDGMNYLGLYDPETGTVGMGRQACREAYPRVFKVHGGYAYSVYFDREGQFGRINRVKID